MASIQSFSDPAFTLNPPALSHTISDHGSHLSLRALPKTDWWRVPPPAPGPVESRTGAFLGLAIDATRDFSAGVWIRGEWGVQFDQGCLMLLAGDSDDVAGDWIKAGVEVETGREYIGAVVTSPWSDWAIAPRRTLHLHSRRPALAIVREGPLLTVNQHIAQRTPDDGGKAPSSEHLIKIREVRGFNLDAAGKPQAKEGDKWRVGPMVCGPTNEAGLKAEFWGFELRYL
ncbi:hypothetical protein B0H14DRAFT_2802456 [Mycena olivaceomarginata]|nr:hypothetical protein B0H14DRAFT_2802456 [Mycena olivaceomarginata]